jgi:signal peptidase I
MKGFSAAHYDRLRNRDIVVAVLAAFLLAFAVNTFVFDIVISEGQSMAPALPSGCVLLVNRLSYGIRNPFTGRYFIRWGEPKQGAIVLFYTPQGDLAVKRCAETADGTFIAHGDNSVESYDSRSYGPVPEDNIVGRVVNYK